MMKNLSEKNNYLFAILLKMHFRRRYTVSGTSSKGLSTLTDLQKKKQKKN